MVPALHGTDTSNYVSIFQNGLLIPGKGNSLKVAHGSAYGLGVYTAKLDNPWLSQDFCTPNQPRMLVCCVIDDVGELMDKDHAWTGQSLRYRNPQSQKDSGKHMFGYVEEHEIWYEWDDYAYYDKWSWDEWNEETAWNEERPRSRQTVSSKNVKHALDSLVIFNASHVIPLFEAVASRWSRPMSCDFDVFYDDWLLSSDLSLHDRMMYWPRGWVARHGQRKVFAATEIKRDVSCEEKSSRNRVSRKGSHAYVRTQQTEESRRRQKQISRNAHAGLCKSLESKRARARLRREWQHELRDECAKTA
jgi:hypothetical protein